MHAKAGEDLRYLQGTGGDPVIAAGRVGAPMVWQAGLTDQ